MFTSKFLTLREERKLSVLEQSAENVWTQKRESDRRVQKIPQ
jgi:hypothetical protein